MAERNRMFFSLCLLLLLALGDASNARKSIEYYELKRGDFSIRVTNWGATILSVILPDKKGHLDDVALGYNHIGGYLNDTTYFGALVGRVANRIAGARFSINNNVYHLYKNDGNNSLHGGHRGFNQVFWRVKERVDGEFPYITFHYRSYDGEQGFPGNLDVSVTYKIDGDYTLSVTMYAKPLNKPTPVNLAQHSYWNLGGHASGTILNHTVQLFASAITPVDSELIPTGAVTPVAGTPFDFRTPRTPGSSIANVTGGYDINYVLDGEADGQGVRKVAVVADGVSGRVLELWGNQPGVQFYTGNFLKGDAGKGGVHYVKHAGLCLETQDYPDAVHHKNFPSEIYAPGQVYKHYMLYKFSLKQ